MSTGHSIMVCVTPQIACARLIEVGKVLADENNATLEILCVFPQKDCEHPDIEALTALQKVANDADAQMSIYFNDSPVLIASSFAAKTNALTVLTGFPRENSSNFVGVFHSLMPDIPVSMVDGDGKVYRILPTATTAHSVSIK